MWEHLSEVEFARRFEVLRTAHSFSMFFSSEWPPADVLGALAHQAGRLDEAIAYWRATGVTVENGGLDDPLLPMDQLSDAARSSANFDALVSNVSTPSNVLREIWESEGPTPELAEHPGIPMDLLLDLEDEDEELILAAAANLSLSEEIFFKLWELEDEDPWRPFTDLRIALMNSPATPGEWLGRPPLDEAWLEGLAGSEDDLFRQEDVMVKVSQMSNPATEPRVLADHGSDINPEVRGAVASNPRCPTDILWILSVDGEAFVRRDAARNSRAPSDLTGLLSEVVEVTRSKSTQGDTEVLVADELLNEGLEAQERENIKEAIGFFSSGVAAGSSICAYKLGFIFDQAGDRTKARTWFAKGSAMGNTPSMNRLAEIAINDDQDFSRARVLFEQVLSCPEDLSSSPLVGRGSALYGLGYLDFYEDSRDSARTYLVQAAEMGIAQATLILQEIDSEAQ